MELLPLCPFCKKPHGHGRTAIGKVVKCQHCRRTLVPWSRALAFTVLLGPFLLQEKISLTHAVGILLVTLGVILVAR